MHFEKAAMFRSSFSRRPDFARQLRTAESGCSQAGPGAGPCRAPAAAAAAAGRAAGGREAGRDGRAERVPNLLRGAVGPPEGKREGEMPSLVETIQA